MEPQVLSREEVKAILAACDNTTTGIRDKAVLATLYRGGTRISATLRIRPSDINWANRLITIHDDKCGGYTPVLDEEALDILRIWNERRKSLEISGHRPFFCAVNKNARGNPVDPSHYRELIKKLQKKAGIEKRCHLHMFRHTCASELLEEGFDIATIARQLGHKRISTTARYLHQIRPDLMNQRLGQRKWEPEQQQEPSAAEAMQALLTLIQDKAPALKLVG